MPTRQVIPLYVRDAIKVFKGRAKIAKALEGIRHRSAVYQWPEDGLVPLGAAVILARKSDGVLTVKDTLYERKRQERLGTLFDARQKKKQLQAWERAPKIR